MKEKLIWKSLILGIFVVLIIRDTGATTKAVVASVSIAIVLEISNLVEHRITEYLLMSIPALEAAFLCKKSTDFWIEWLVLIAIVGFGYRNLLQYENTMERIHKVRDEGAELELKLRNSNKQLRKEQDQQVRNATLAERNRIAREIHDNVGHLLSRAILFLGAIKIVNQEETVKTHLETLEQTLNQAMNDMRNSVHDLHDDSIDPDKNMEELLSLLKDYEVVTDMDGFDGLELQVTLTIIAVCKEAVNNIIRHSNGNRVEIMLHNHPGFVTFSVYDNGTGQVSSGAGGMKKKGIGLSNMSERVEELGGIMTIEAKDGFRIFINLPKGKGDQNGKN